MTVRVCALVPVYNHHRCIASVVASLRAHGLAVILVDDGSDSTTQSVLASLVDGEAVQCLTQPYNKGKGAACLRGFDYAYQCGYTHALQVDADGQHDLTDVPRFLKHAKRDPDCIISGRPAYDDSVPAVRFYGRYLTHALIWLDTLSLSLRDSMCGYRVYPLAPALALARRVRIGARMDFDTDIMTRLYWAGTDSIFISTRVHYPPQGLSNFRMGRDNLRMAWLHLRLFAGMWPRSVHLLARSWRRRRERRRQRHWARTNERGSLSGIRFMGAADYYLGRRVCRWILAPVVIYFLLTHPKARHASKTFLRAAGCTPNLRHRFQQLMNFSESILDKVNAWRAPSAMGLDLSDCQTLIDTIQSGQGALLLTAHLGNAEASRALSQRIPGLRVNALVHSDNSAIVNHHLKAANADYPLRLIQVSQIDMGVAVMLKQKIDAGEVVVIAADRIPVGDNSPVARVPFLGREAAFALGPYILAHVLECPVYSYFCVRSKRRHFKIIAPKFADRINLPRRQRHALASDYAAQFAEQLGEYARRYPLQWYNFYDIWAAQPANTPPSQEVDNARRAA